MKKTTTLTAILLTSLMAIPMVALAQSTAVTSITTGLGSFGTIIDVLTNHVVTSLSTLAATSAMVVFFYGIVMYIWGVREGDASVVAKGNVFLRWGLVALFVMFSVWGIVIYVQRIFGIQGNSTIVIPQIQLGGSTPTASNPLAPGAFDPANNGKIVDYQSCIAAGNTPQTCENGFGAPTGTTQSSGTGNVGADCNTPSECRSGLSCTNFTCQQPTAQTQTSGTGNVGADCTSPSECVSGLTCSNFTCQTPCTPGNACTVGGFNGQCGTDNICRAGGSR